ncbi:SH3 type 3 domain-containing protein [Rhodospirillum rubrum F11]|uniref:SH3 domain-containing protein n=2 Tax=Rhodospirillum rubrum TaxID=1085 RepID=UPI00003C2F2F|nr:SH3 domain-containing protein [Rhodospirillum rubrum]AEO46857.1 SH3 type 3 domain-containing protein [Rhodospirillum rubrum F11]QXG80874.1 SH3 domain-containing protein [Rhodospirillum rubrum]
MKLTLATALLGSALVAAAPALADPGWSASAVRMRAGPGTDFPAVVVVPAAVGLDIIGCLAGYTWCDVIWGANRGWVSGNYLRARPRGIPVPLIQGPPPPVVVFDFPVYWADHYREKPFYARQEQWRPRGPAQAAPAPQPPPERPASPQRRDDRGQGGPGRGPGGGQGRSPGFQPGPGPGGPGH